MSVNLAETIALSHALLKDGRGGPAAMTSAAFDEILISSDIENLKVVAEVAVEAGGRVQRDGGLSQPR